MPYPAPPSIPPPAVTAPPLTALNDTKSDAPIRGPIVDIQTVDREPPVYSASISPKAAPSIQTTTDFVKQTGKSRAALLGAGSSQGYLLGDRPNPVVRELAEPSEQAKTSSKYRSYLPPLLPSAASSATTSSPVTTKYELLGLSQSRAGKRPTKQQEADLMLGLDRAVTLQDEASTVAVAPNGKPRARLDTLLQTLDAANLAQAQPPLQPNPVEPQFDPPGPQPSNATPQNPPPDEQQPPPPRIVELTADRQSFDEQRRIFTAEGNVMMRFQGALLDADRLQVNLINRVAVAEGNVALTRGTQVLRGQRFVYNFVQGVGRVEGATGEIFVPAASTDLAAPVPGSPGEVLDRPLSDRVRVNQPVQNVSSPGGVSIGVGAGRDVGRVPGALPRGGEIRRFRFEAEKLDFTPDGWQANNIQITNDPFSPPELVLKAERATLTRLSPLRDEVRAEKPRLVFDQSVSLPIPFSRTIIDRNQRQQAGLFRFGYDDQDRGGVFIERTFDLLSSSNVRFSLTPQIYLQRMFFDTKSVFNRDNFGFRSDLAVDVSTTTSLRGKVAFSSLDFGAAEDRLRASLRVRQLVGTHTMAFEYSYRDRLFNGSLGFQTVQSSLGAVLTSPVIELANTGIFLNYQAGYQYINSETDRFDLLELDRDNNRINLGRFQASATINKGFPLWVGKPLPATATEGLRYTPNPVVPYLSLNTQLRGVSSIYSNGDTQQNLVASVGLLGQVGHFSRSFLDYTAFNVTYTQVIGSGQSPFLFDRSVDNRILTLGLTQQIYGPIRFGIQTSLNLDTRDAISTDYILEYSRRTYGIIMRYNPVLSIGAISLRISDFNWTGNGGAFETLDVTPVDPGGILRRRVD